MFDCFRGQADVATLDIGLNIFFEARPIVFPTNELLSFIDTKMPNQWIVVVPTDELRLNDFRYKR